MALPCLLCVRGDGEEYVFNVPASIEAHAVYSLFLIMLSVNPIQFWVNIEIEN